VTDDSGKRLCFILCDAKHEWKESIAVYEAQFFNCFRKIGHFHCDSERVERFVNVHLHFIVSNLKRMSKISTLPVTLPWINFCGHPCYQTDIEHHAFTLNPMRRAKSTFSNVGVVAPFRISCQYRIVAHFVLQSLQIRLPVLIFILQLIRWWNSVTLVCYTVTSRKTFLKCLCCFGL